MPFKLPKESRSFFKPIDDSSKNKFETLFDKYYMCLMMGLSREKLGMKEEVEPQEFVDYYPELYVDKKELIMGLLINAEAKRQGISNKDSLEKLMLELIDDKTVTKLSSKGVDKLNLYAAGGMNIISDQLDKTDKLEEFLVHYYRLINNDENEAV
ncbi:hypothetical protein [Pontibacillus salipaludis]|uniref:Uncharacterized protein n=1 Tax=Pontibacillus salipaludis TaxID=1697394 RepID=A0ABQ1PIQ2_9BACI|nr:hypothetical protein [Pontibacillus salipaludis]GGC97919.1 hypothetical protein GCM10011389_01320 [Pontibacillus salipaludis]